MRSVVFEIVGDLEFFRHRISYTFADPLLCALLCSPEVEFLKIRLRISVPCTKQRVSRVLCVVKIGAVFVEKPTKDNFGGFNG